MLWYSLNAINSRRVIACTAGSVVENRYRVGLQGISLSSRHLLDAGCRINAVRVQSVN